MYDSTLVVGEWRGVLEVGPMTVGAVATTLVVVV